MTYITHNNTNELRIGSQLTDPIKVGTGIRIFKIFSFQRNYR